MSSSFVKQVLGWVWRYQYESAIWTSISIVKRRCDDFCVRKISYRFGLDLCIWSIELPLLRPFDIDDSINDCVSNVDALGSEFSS